MALSDEFGTLFRSLRRKSADESIIWLIGPLPPAANGQVSFNVEVIGYLRRYKPVVALSAGTSIVAKIARAFWLPLVVLFFVRRRDVVYTSLAGRNGVWTFLGLTIALRLLGRPYFIHHHSFRPINMAPLMGIRLLCWIGGPLQRHILLSTRMATAFGQIYLTEEQRQNCLTLPNAFLYPAKDAQSPHRSGPIVLGHLSMITKAKGVVYLLELFKRLSAMGKDYRLELGGPIKDPELKAVVEAAVAESNGLITWLGPVYGKAKEEFFQRLDLFVLPTTLIDEADPLVVIEAYMHGCDVAASDRGCITERLRRPEALVVFDLEKDANMLLSEIGRIGADRLGNAQQCALYAQELNRQANVCANAFLSALGCGNSEVVGPC